LLTCGAFFVYLACKGGMLEERLSAAAEVKHSCDVGGSCEPVRTWTISQLQWTLVYFLSGDGFFSWRCKAAFAITKMIFALSAFPFFPLSMVGIIGQLFTHADPTAYTPDGRLTVMDTTGLSAYLVWLREDVLDASRFKHELMSDFDPKDLARLREALVDGEDYLRETWAHRLGDVKKRCTEKKKKIQAVVKAVIKRGVASDALFTHVFPDEVLIEGFKAEQHKHKQAMAKQNPKQKP